MKVIKNNTGKTRNRLIDAASIVFSLKDYRTATIAEICDLAGANVAAVNYHFGNKETLYREAWRDAFRRSVEVHPPNGGVSNDAPAQERLRGAIRALLARFTDKDDKEFLIVNREMANPTGLLEEVMENELMPLHERMEAIVQDLLGKDSPAERVRFCALSITNQCLHPMLLKRLDKEAKSLLGVKFDIKAYTDHVIEFSLGGINSIAKANQRQPSKSNKKTNLKK